MQFVIGKKKEIKTTVEWYEPADEGEKKEKVSIAVWFRIQPKSVKKKRDKATAKQLKEISNMLQGRFKDAQDANQENEQDAFDSDLQLDYLLEDITNLEGPVDDKGETVPFDKELLEAVLDDDCARAAIELKWKQIQDRSLWNKEKAKN